MAGKFKTTTLNISPPLFSPSLEGGGRGVGDTNCHIFPRYLLFLLCLLFAAPVFAGPVVLPYARCQPVFRVAELTAASQGGAASGVVAALARSAERPAGWRWENPLAEDRTPDDPAYWTATLEDANAARLAGCDLLVLAWAGTAPLETHEAELLRDLLRQGVTLWVDDAHAGTHPAPVELTTPPVAFAGGAATGDPTAVLEAADPAHALLAGLSEEEVGALCAGRCPARRDCLTAGVAGLADSDASPLTTVVRLRIADGGGPAIAAGKIGRGTLIVSATHISGSITGAHAPGYTACCKLVMNMLAGMAKAASLPARLSPAGEVPMTAGSAPASCGEYIAVVAGSAGVPSSPDRGRDARGPNNELRVYHHRKDGAAGLELCFAVTGKRWLGAPAFGQMPRRILPAGAQQPVVITRTVVAALEETGSDGCRPHCYAVDSTPTATPVELWAGPALSGAPANFHLVISGNRVAITGAKDGIALLDLRTGTPRARVGMQPAVPATLLSADFVTTYVDFPATDSEMGLATTGGLHTRRALVELLTVERSAVPAGHPALWQAPPMIIAHLAPPHLPITRVPADMTLSDSAGRRYAIGNPNDAFRRRYLLCIKPEGNRITLLFRNWDVFLPSGMAVDAPLTPPLTLAYTPELPSGVRLAPAINPPLTGLEPVLGAPIPLDGTGNVPPVYAQGQLLASTCGGMPTAPLLRDSSHHTATRTPRAGTLTGITPSLSGTAEDAAAWQFYGDTRGPREGGPGQCWQSDFPYPAASGEETVFTVGRYTRWSQLDGSAPVELHSADATATLYALAPPMPSALRQVAQAGTVAAWPPADPHVLLVRPGKPDGPLRIGARLLLAGAAMSDLGAVLHIASRQPFDPADPQYWVTVERACPDIAQPADAAALTLLAATGTPNLRHAPCAAPPPGNPANADPRDGRQEVMIALTGLEDANATFTDPAALAAWRKRAHLYLPRLSPERQFNYRVDTQSGRIELAPRAAGELADRFVVVHYFTGAPGGAPMRQAEIMYVPTPVQWQYQFPDALPMGGPALVGDTVFMTALRHVEPTRWQPTLYAFAAAPDDPYHVRPLSVQPLGEPMPAPDAAAHAFTLTPAAGGLLASTAPGALALLADRGTLVADGQRLLRLDSAGSVTWQAVATRDADPAALASPTPAVRDTGDACQEFALVTRLRRLPEGHLLLCDTGASRVVEIDRAGQVCWQYPDSDVTFRDPDRKLTGAGETDARADHLVILRGATPPELRISLPRDARRYTREALAANIRWAAPSGTVRDLGAAMVRWEITLIADAGNHRILEVYRPLVRLEMPALEDGGANIRLAAGFHYRPDLFYLYHEQRVYLTQFAEVVADGASLTWQGGTFPTSLIFTAALRCPGPDNALPDTLADDDPVKSGLRSRELLAVVGNRVQDPVTPAMPLRTVRLSHPSLFLRAEMMRHPTLPTANALAIRAQSNDYLQVRQLDLAPIRQGAAVELRALVVDAAGVREVPLAADRQTAPAFEMTAETYARALQNCPYWEQAVAQRLPALPTAEAAMRGFRLDAWRKDAGFVPVAVERIDDGDADPRRVRYLIAQASAHATLNPTALIDGAAVPRVHLFEARWLHPATPYAGHQHDGWGIIDHRADYVVMPDPLALDFPNIAGKTYPLSQPLAVEGEFGF